MQLPLNLPQVPSSADALDRLVLHANMATLNPKGFRTPSTKKNRKRVKTRAEKLAELLE